MALIVAFLSAALIAINLSGVAEGAATITTLPVNTTAQLGSSASFFCGLTGTQDPGQYNTFRKISPTTSLIASDANPSNATKYNITDTYRLTIYDVAISDEGVYQCDLFPNTYTMALSVIDAPSAVTVTWGDSATTTTAGVSVNLTCNVARSRPPATLRWTRGSSDVTSSAMASIGTTDSDGYGSSTSVITMTPTASDVGAVYTCYVDLNDSQNVTQSSLTVAFSGASLGQQFNFFGALLTFAAAAFLL